MDFFLQDLQLTNYKSHGKFIAELNPKLNAFLGKNGVGKTNVLDAIYYACLGKSYFSSGDRLVVSHGSNFHRISAHFSKNGHVQNFVVKVIPGKSKELSIDGKKLLKIADHVGKFPCIMVSPQDIQLLLDGSKERRKFFNNTLIQTHRPYIQATIKYNRLLKQRNALLKQFLEQRYFDDQLIQAISAEMHHPSAIIYRSRSTFIEQLSPLFAELYRQISQSAEACEITYKSDLHQDSLLDIFAKNLEKDRILGRTSQGIHKDDLQIKMNGLPIKPFGSQGQLKTFVLALKLAQYLYLKQTLGIKPILLLDDLFDKLDSSRVSQLLHILHGRDYGQVILTDKDPVTIPLMMDQISENNAIFVIDEISPEHSEEE